MTAPLRSFAILLFLIAAWPLPSAASLSKPPTTAPILPATPPTAAAAVSPEVVSPVAESQAVVTPVPAQTIDHEEIRALARKGLLDSALRLSLKALELDSNDLFAMFMAAKLCPEGKSSGAYFQKVIKTGGNGPEAEESYFRLGQYSYAAGKYPSAIPFFRDYLKRFPSGDWIDPARYWMGNACLSLAQSKPDKRAYFDSAFAYFQQLSLGQKTDGYYLPLALEGQAKAKAGQGDREGAWKAAQAALENAPEEERAALLLLSAQLRQGVDAKEEQKLIDTLVAKYPQSPEARYLTKLNVGIPASHWKSGSTFPKGTPAALKDTIVVTPPPHPGPVMEFTLQLGAFSQSPNAKAMIHKVTKLGFAPELVESNRNGKPIFQIRLGRFATPEDASEYARKNLKPHELLSQPVPLTP